MKNERESNYFVNSVAKGFEVLKAFDSSSSYLSLSDLERKTGINKATVRRFALTLADLGYLRVHPDYKFSLSPKVLDLGANYLESLYLPDLAHPILVKIASEVKESTNLAILDHADIVYISRVKAAERIIGSNLHIGSRLPYYATSLGKALVAWLPKEERKQLWNSVKAEAFTPNTITDFDMLEEDFEKCRIRGYAEGCDELEIGLRSIAVPIFNWKGEPIAAMNISTNSMRSSEEKIKNVYLPALLEGAEELNRQVGFHKL
ncbi:MAG TPA: IclR family transcriptional regulator C-terminal domain-containing protein [Bacillus sp. (in: firmicutes)]|uniref:IclR family transcriptional regulator domain-containing protein n=1 Tax=Bacillus litorisediminis TaxID=2922713 RepID=UPI001FAC7F7A|nr:IclR family transcriptional regulator C-terminal domain-containing protein [Bacillus litorisediminis]HWO78702.1 IclR family transcriptional regulator C-terminal domain-containing protein [Bacillus sp. (in: firmicutes)]